MKAAPQAPSILFQQSLSSPVYNLLWPEIILVPLLSSLKGSFPQQLFLQLQLLDVEMLSISGVKARVTAMAMEGTAIPSQKPTMLAAVE